VAVPSRKYCEATEVGTDEVVVQNPNEEFFFW